MVRQELMHADCDKLLVMLAGPKGTLTLLNQIVKCLDPVALRAEIHSKTLAIVQALEETKTHVGEVKAKIDTCTDDTIIKIESAIVKVTQECDNVKKNAEQHSEALQLSSPTLKNRTRKAYLANRNQVVKYAGYMSTMNFPRNLAKLFGSHVLDFQLYKAELEWTPNFENDTFNCNFSKLAIWRDPSTCPLAQCIANNTRKIQEDSSLRGKTDGGDLALVKIGHGQDASSSFVDFASKPSSPSRPAST